MSWSDVLTNNHAAIHGIFTPEGMGTVGGDQKAVLASYSGPGRVQFLKFWEGKGKLPLGTADAAAAGMSPQDLARAVQGAYRDQAAGVASEAAHAGQAAQAVDAGMQAAYGGRQTLGMMVPSMVATPQGAAAINPVYGGLMGQQMASFGYAPAATEESIAAAAADGRRVLAQMADAAPQGTDAAAAAAAGLVDGAPLAANTGEGLMDVPAEVLEQLGHAPAGSAAADVAAVDAAAAAAAHAAPAVDAAAAEHAAQMEKFVGDALDFLATQHPQRQVDVLAATLADLAAQGKIEPVEQLLAMQLGRANAEDVAPALWKAIESGGAVDVASDAAHYAGSAGEIAHDVTPLLARVGEGASPAVVEAAARLAAGQGRMMSMEKAISTALRELPK